MVKENSKQTVVSLGGGGILTILMIIAFPLGFFMAEQEMKSRGALPPQTIYQQNNYTVQKALNMAGEWCIEIKMVGWQPCDEVFIPPMDLADEKSLANYACQDHCDLLTKTLIPYFWKKGKLIVNDELEINYHVFWKKEICVGKINYHPKE
ncbi:MAG: hypothetical protein PHT40_00995 [Patescibacteria group bacterium]|nr:hypothetical protein [Patescibacteria group bacterium]